MDFQRQVSVFRDTLSGLEGSRIAVLEPQDQDPAAEKGPSLRSAPRPRPGPAHTTAAAQRDFLASAKREPPS